MNYLLLLPMLLCFIIGFYSLGILIYRAWLRRQASYPITFWKLREFFNNDKNTRYMFNRVATWCDVIGAYNPEAFMLFSLIGSGVGFLLGLLTRNIIVSLSLFLLFLLVPWLLLYATYVITTNRKIKSFAVFSDLFARYYSGHKNIMLAFREMIDECPKDLQSELIILNNRLADGSHFHLALEQFAERLNHSWAEDFATYIMSGLEGETEDIQSALNRLTNEMFVQQDEWNERRSEIHAIWISLIAVIMICLLLIPYNQILLEDSYRLYFFTADGQSLLSLAVMTWSFSILLAFIWARRSGS
ncbi:hypothetical protein C4A75_18185 [Brevibacillus laterosporus]|uniref:type II secretion system F family protein n=1 Tax=Brevibacillus laterosporus TaxID=1465 RepID=UPI000CE46E4D|nr:type II secretion system F family protein [Brevibacillus laterosporus]PPA82732.1 hypothetical protein C4A75_18185 [Brevibacillus laterosporus]